MIRYIAWPEDTKTACDLYSRLITPIMERLLAGSRVEP